MSKRLEDIKNRFRDYKYDFNLRTEDIDWLIEQAERAQKNAQDLEDMDRQLASEQKRVQELEEENKRLESFIENLQSIHFTELQRERAENQRYRKALEFYAHKKNYDIKHLSEDEHEIPVFKDYGEKARQALGQEEF